MRFSSFLVFSIGFFTIFFLSSPTFAATDVLKTPENPNQRVLTPSTTIRTVKPSADIVDRSSLSNYENELLESTNKNVFSSNLNFIYDHFQLDAPAYLSFPILDNVNESLLSKIAPAKYSTFDMQSRSRLPINRYNSSVNMNKSFYTDDSDFITGALFDFIFGALTKNIFSMNFNFLALKDDPNGINMNFVIKPLKNIMFKFSRIEVTEEKQSIFEIQIIPTQKTLLTFKTSDSDRSTSTGIEFEMKF